MNKILTLLLVTAAVIVTSCTTTEIALVSDPKTAGLPPIYMTKLPEQPYTEVGYISVWGSIVTTKPRLVRDLQKAAAKNGMDAVINVKYNYQWWWPVVEGVGVKFEGKP